MYRWRGTQEGLWVLVLVECTDKYGSGGGLLCLGTKRKEGNRFLFKVSKKIIANYVKKVCIVEKMQILVSAKGGIVVF